MLNANLINPITKLKIIIKQIRFTKFHTLYINEDGEWLDKYKF